MSTKHPKYCRYYPKKLPEVLTFAALVAWATPSLLAQTEIKAEDKKAESTVTVEDETTLVLSPFEVTTQKDKGYAASSSLAGSRLNTELRDVGAAVQVITPEFMKDIGANNLQKLLVYTTNTEVAGVGGNFYGGNADSKGYARGMLVDPHTTTRIRGLNNADITREFFPTDIPIDWYSLSRVDISRGPNSILFGLGSPAGLINNTLKVPNMKNRAVTVELNVGSYGSTREMIDADFALIPNQLGLRVAVVNDDAKFRQEFTYNHDKRIFGTVRWQPKLAEHVFTQLDAQFESGRIKANRPTSTTPSDFISNWYGPANRLSIPNDEYWTAPGYSGDGLYADQTIGGQLWDNHAVSFFSDPSSGAVGMAGNPTQAMLLRGNNNVNGGGWGSWVGIINPNWVGNSGHVKNTKSYYANNPTVTAILNNYEAQTGRTFSGFGQGLWPTQMIVSGPLADMAFNENLIGPNKSEHNNLNVLNLGFTQTFFRGRLGINAAYNRQVYRTGYTNLMEGLWGVNMISIDVNQTLRGSTTPNPNYGRPYTIGEGRGGLFQKDRENWRVTGFGVLKASDFFKSDSLLTKMLGEHTFTGVVSSQRFRNFDRYYALYRWPSEYLLAVDGPNGDGTPKNFATWRGIHYLGGSLLNTTSMANISGVTGVRTLQVPSLTQNVRHYNQPTGTWAQSNFSLMSADNDLGKLYDGAGEGYDITKSRSFVWQGKMFGNVIVPIFGWRKDVYNRWDKHAPHIANPTDLNDPDRLLGGKDKTYGYTLPFDPAWNYAGVKPVHADEQRRSWSVALHGKELMELFHYSMPQGTDITLLYNDSTSFRPSDVAVDVYNRPEKTPSGETKDVSVLLAYKDRVSLRITKYKTTQHNTVFGGAAPDWGWTKANLARSMDGMMWEVGGWAGSDPTKRVQPTPEWLVNKWMFGTSYNQAIANTPLPTNWQSDPNILNQPLRIRRSAVVGSPTYVAQGTINPDTGVAYVAPPLEADEVAYRTAWFRARSDAEWSRPVDQAFWQAQAYARDYTAGWGGFWEPDAWKRPPNQKHMNDLVSTGMEYELTANPLPNWRISMNASKADAVRSNVLDSWDAFIASNKAFYFDGASSINATPAANYWTYTGYYDIAQTPDVRQLGTTGRLGSTFRDSIYQQYYQAKATEDQAVSELRKWHFNAVTNYTFTKGFLKNVGIGGAFRWEDRSTIGYYPTFNSDANAWVIDLNKPIKGPTEQHYDAWISYERSLGHGIKWSIQLNVNDVFSEKKLVPIQANPDGTIAQVRIPSLTTWNLRNTFNF